jgi:hypothetical protein
MLEQKAKVQMDHLRGMTPRQVAVACLRTLERGRHEVSLTAGGRLLVLVCRFLPGLADRIARRKVRSLFREEIAARRAQRADIERVGEQPVPVPPYPLPPALREESAGEEKSAGLPPVPTDPSALGSGQQGRMPQ